MTHIHISIRTPVQQHSILLYTVYPRKALSESDVYRFYEFLEKRFLQPLQEKVIQLEAVFQDLYTLFSEFMRTDYATHWHAVTKAVRAHTEKVICNMTDVHLSFMLVNGTEMQTVHMNEEDSMKRLVALFA